MRTLIGARERKAGLFWGVPKVTIMVIEASKDLWYKCFSHLSARVMCALPCMSKSNSRFNKYDCNVCFRAHHPRTFFPSF